MVNPKNPPSTEESIDLGQTGFMDERLAHLPPPGEADLNRRRSQLWWLLGGGLVVIFMLLGILIFVKPAKSPIIVSSPSIAPTSTPQPAKPSPALLLDLKNQMDRINSEPWSIEPPPVDMDLVF